MQQPKLLNLSLALIERFGKSEATRLLLKPVHGETSLLTPELREAERKIPGSRPLGYTACLRPTEQIHAVTEMIFESMCGSINPSINSPE